MDKKTLRQQLLQKRNELRAQQIEEKSQAISQQLEAHSWFKKVKRILLYHSHHNEVSTLELIQKYREEKKIYLPILKPGNTFEIGLFQNLESLVKNKYGIPEPREATQNPKLDLIILPGVGFDLNGNRLGMGKGYYDRFLAKNQEAKRIALAFEFQILDRIPKGPYDESAHLIITEKRVIECD